MHSPLIDVLLRFRLHRVALTADVSKMYRAIELANQNRDLHRFVWRRSPDQPLQDYHMTRVTFGVSASSFVANMSVKQNALDFALEYPQAVTAVEKSFYVDDGLTGADSVEEALQLQKQLQELFSRGGFLLRKWNSSEAIILQHITPELRDSQSLHAIPDPDEYTKTLGIQWNSGLDHFRLTVAEIPKADNLTKRLLVSDIAKTFDVLGWFSPSIIKINILLQRIWELKIDWDASLPSEIETTWLQWRTEPISSLWKAHSSMLLPQAISHRIRATTRVFRCLRGSLCYFRMVDSLQRIHTSLVAKVAPIKRLTVPRLELCGAHLLARLLHHVQRVFHLPVNSVYAWTDSMVVLSWLVGNPKRFKTYVGNRISHIVELIPDRWNHVSRIENPADCASRGLFPSELLDHKLWWNGPTWLKSTPHYWPRQSNIPPTESSEEVRQICHHIGIGQSALLILFDRYSSFNHLKRVTALTTVIIDNVAKGFLLTSLPKSSPKPGSLFHKRITSAWRSNLSRTTPSLSSIRATSIHGLQWFGSGWW